MVEHKLAKPRVASSNLAAHSYYLKCLDFRVRTDYAEESSNNLTAFDST